MPKSAKVWGGTEYLNIPLPLRYLLITNGKTVTLHWRHQADTTSSKQSGLTSPVMRPIDSMYPWRHELRGIQHFFSMHFPKGTISISWESIKPKLEDTHKVTDQYTLKVSKSGKTKTEDLPRLETWYLYGKRDPGVGPGPEKGHQWKSGKIQTKSVVGSLVHFLMMLIILWLCNRFTSGESGSGAGEEFSELFL